MADQDGEMGVMMGKRHYVGIAAVAACLIVGVAVGIANSNDNEVGSCPPGSHFEVSLTQPNGEVSTTEVKRDIRELPPGSSIVSGGDGERVVIHQDGRVEARGGEAELECIRPPD